MAVITEATVRAWLKEKGEQPFTWYKKDIVTPSAKQFLKDHKMEVLIEPTEVKEKAVLKEEESTGEQVSLKPKYICYETGAFFMEKPEHMTHIKGNELVLKNHKRIVLRGKIDSFLGQVIDKLQLFQNEKKEDLVKDLKEIYLLIKAIQRAEILDEPLKPFLFLEMDEVKQREVSHNPKTYFGVPHLFEMDETTNSLAVRLNLLRTLSRELEIVAVEAFENKGVLERPDLAKAMNRMSSCLYILMLKAVSGAYDGVKNKKR